MLTGLIAFLFRVAAPKAPTWVPLLITALIKATMELVDELRNHDAAGADKRAAVIVGVSGILDETLDDLPAWGDLTEDQRDRMIGGVTELALVVLNSLTAKDEEPKTAGLVARLFGRK
tara:strand:+ start:4997 stop:5350 length:354 start_codon:yes stop_codon:yes gene_type:complete